MNSVPFVAPTGGLFTDIVPFINFTGLYLATGGKKVAEQHLDPGEEIEAKLFPLEEVRQMLQHNEIIQSMHATCLFYGFSKLDGLK